MTADWDRRAVEVVCNNSGHAPGVHVAWLFPDAPGVFNCDALLANDEPLDTVKIALLRQAHGDRVRGKYRFICPVCGERGATPEARAEVLTRIIGRLAALGVSRLDVYSLERYCSG